MKNFNTLLGTVNVTDARISRKSGYGQYRITIYFEFEGKQHEVNVHSTDSELFDDAHREDNHSQIVMERCDYLIEQEVNDFISSL